MILQLVLFQIAFFILLLFGMRKLFHGHLTSAIGRVNKLHEKAVEEEEKIKNYELEVRKLREVKIRELDEELKTRRQQVETDAKALVDRLKGEVGKERESLIQEFGEKEKAMQRKLKIQSRREGCSIASQILDATFSEGMLENLHRIMSDELIASLSKTAEQVVDLKSKKIKIHTAFALHKDVQTKLETQLRKASKTKLNAKDIIQIEETLKPELVAGFIVYLDEVILDGSLSNRFDKEVKRLSQ